MSKKIKKKMKRIWEKFPPKDLFGNCYWRKEIRKGIWVELTYYKLEYFVLNIEIYKNLICRHLEIRSQYWLNDFKNKKLDLNKIEKDAIKLLKALRKK